MPKTFSTKLVTDRPNKIRAQTGNKSLLEAAGCDYVHAGACPCHPAKGFTSLRSFHPLDPHAPYGGPFG